MFETRALYDIQAVQTKLNSAEKGVNLFVHSYSFIV